MWESEEEWSLMNEGSFVLGVYEQWGKGKLRIDKNEEIITKIRKKNL